MKYRVQMYKNFEGEEWFVVQHKSLFWWFDNGTYNASNNTWYKTQFNSYELAVEHIDSLRFKNKRKTVYTHE